MLLGSLTAFFTLLRRSNIFYAKSSRSYLKMRDLISPDDETALRVKQLKTGKHKGSEIMLPLPRVTAQPFCPASALRSLTSGKARDINAPLFSYLNHDKQRVPLLANKFLTLLRAVLNAAGYDMARFSCHSF